MAHVDGFQYKELKSEGPESLQAMTADTMISNLGHVAEEWRKVGATQ